MKTNLFLDDKDISGLETRLYVLRMETLEGTEYEDRALHELQLEIIRLAKKIMFNGQD